MQVVSDADVADCVRVSVLSKIDDRRSIRLV